MDLQQMDPMRTLQDAPVTVYESPRTVGAEDVLICGRPVVVSSHIHINHRELLSDPFMIHLHLHICFVLYGIFCLGPIFLIPDLFSIGLGVFNIRIIFKSGFYVSNVVRDAVVCVGIAQNEVLQKHHVPTHLRVSRDGREG